MNEKVSNCDIIKRLPVRCPVCGGYYPKLDRKHALEHGFSTLKEFKEAHGINYTTLLQRSREKIKQLYNIDYTRWGQVYHDANGDVRYVTKQYFRDFDKAKSEGIRSATKFPLGDDAFTRHFTGENPLAILAEGSHSRYFGFDIDTKEKALAHALKIVATLESEGIHENDIHVSFSGGKGYHIELFIEKHLRFSQWVTFGQYIVYRAGLTGEAIEFRPEASNGRAWKLPLTYHHKTGMFAGYIANKRTFEVLGEFESHEYLANIKQMPLSRILPIVKRAEQHKAEVQAEIEASRKRKLDAEKERRKAVKVIDERVFQTKDEKIQSAIRYLNEGLVEQGTRWTVTRTLALYLYHEERLDVKEIKNILMEWTEQQIDNGLALTPLEDCEKEIDKILEWIPRSWGFGAKVRELSITRHELDFVLEVTNKSARALLWALLLKSKAFADNRDKTFFTTDRDLQKMLSMKRNTIAKYRRWLAERGYIEVWKDNRAYFRKKATVYRINIEEETEQAEIIDTIQYDDSMDCRDLLTQIASKLYTQEKLRKLKLI